MILRNKNIILVSPESWEHIFVSKHHYAIHLAAMGNKVFFVGPPAKEEGISKTKFENVWEVKYKGFIKGLRYLPFYIQKRELKKAFNKLENICKVNFDIIWSFDTSVFYDFSILPTYLLKICHIVDMNQNFQFERAARTANYCFCSSHDIEKRFLKFNLNTYKINHGVNQKYNSKKSIELPGENKIKCMYAGNLDIPYIDWDLIKNVVAFKDIDFIFAGKWSNKNNDLINLENFYYIGCIESNDLISYYSSADLLLLCYRYSAFPEQLSNPHKMMEYFASGKMIVATFSKEYDILECEDLLFMASTKNEYLNYFQEAVKNIEYYNSLEKQKQRKEFAAKNSYDEQIERIKKIINQKI